jgi:hypothetical protein
MKDSAYMLFGRGEKDGRDEFEQELRDMVSRSFTTAPASPCGCPSTRAGASSIPSGCAKRDPGIDDTRTIDHASGWHDQKIGDIQSLHVYFKKYAYKPDKLGRAVVLSEFGGYSHRVSGHCFGEKEFGYKKFESPLLLESALEELYSSQIAPRRSRVCPPPCTPSSAMWRMSSTDC